MEENKDIAIKAEQQNNVLFQDVCLIIDQTQAYAYHLVNETLIKRNWLLGMRIQHEVLQGQRVRIRYRRAGPDGRRWTWQ